MNDLEKKPFWRSQLIVPVNVPRFVDKAHLRGADAIILDLEDSVTQAEKPAARALVAEAAHRCAARGADVLVRVNQPLRLAVPDIEAAVGPAVRGLMLPKIDSASHVRLLAELVESVEAERGLPRGQTVFMIVIETPDAFFQVREIAAAHPRIVALSLGTEDFAAATRSEPDPEVLLYPKQQVALAASAAGAMPMGVMGSIANYSDVEGYRTAIARARRFGFQGASCIHPDVVPLLNAGFGPTAEEIFFAERVVSAFDAAEAEGRGALAVDGKMVDLPVVLRARNTLATARRIREREARAAAA